MNRPSPFKTMSLKKIAVRSLAAVASASLLVGMTGCSMGGFNLSGPAPVDTASGSAIKGTVMGGQQPVTGSTLQLYAAGAPASGGGYGSGATALFAVLNGTTTGYFPGGQSGCVPSGVGVTPVVTCTQLPTTDASGSFNITGDYTCPSANSQMYLVATGGNPQTALTQVTSNPYISLMVALGPCSGLASLPYITLNEVTTAAGVYALNQFMSAPATSTVEAIGAPGTTYNGVQSAVVGLTNAFTMVNNISNSQYGTSTPTVTTANAGSIYFPEATLLNSVANIIASCVNSDPNAPTSSTNCSTLMTDATPTGSTLATDTLQAAYYIVHYPFNTTSQPTRVSTLAGLAGTTPPFSGTTSIIDFTLQVSFEPNYNSATLGPQQLAIAEPSSVAFDAYGNAWIYNKGQATGTYLTTALPASVVEVGPNASVLMQPVTAYNTAFNSSGNAIGGAAGNGTPVASGGTSLFTTQPTGATLVRTFGASGTIAIDPSNQVWVTNTADAGAATTPTAMSVAVFSGSTGANVASAGILNGYFVGNAPDGIAIDGSGNVFIAATGNAASAGTLAGKSINEFVAGSSTAFTYSANTASSFKTTAPYALLGGITKLAIDQNTSVTNNFPLTLPTPGAAITNDGPVLWTANKTDCTIASASSGTLHQYTTKDLLPTANSAITSASATGTNACATTVAAVSLLPYAVTTANPNGFALGSPDGIAIDKNNNVWLANTYTSSTAGFDGLTYIQTSAATDAVDPTMGSSTYASSAIGGKGTSTSYTNQPFNIAVDGNNAAWIGNGGTALNAISVFTATTASGSAPTINPVAVLRGAANHSNNTAPGTLGIDPSGNVWTMNQSTNITSPAAPIAGTGRGQFINILVGAAAPVVTPLSVAIQNKVLGQKP